MQYYKDYIYIQVLLEKNMGYPIVKVNFSDFSEDFL